MKLYLISQSENTNYDTYDCAVVAAKSEDVAQTMSPSNGSIITEWKAADFFNDWCSCPENVTVTLIGTATKGTKQGVICASFNAG